MGDGLVIAAGQFAGVAVTVGQVERFEYLHDLLGILHVGPLLGRRRNENAE